MRHLMICLVHGYSLTGSGSNLWTRAIARGLCAIGETVHLVCQEERPERYNFISEAYRYGADGVSVRLFERGAPYPGRCILHRPDLQILPTYVQPSAQATSMAAIIDLPDEAISDYLDRNERVLHHVVREYPITAVHVNHVVLMAVAMERVHVRTGVPFAVMPHGSAIEYVVKRSPKMQKLASDALAASGMILTLSDEMRTRLVDVFPEVPNLEAKMVMSGAGVDTDQFLLVPRADRRQPIDRLKRALADIPRGKAPENSTAMLREISGYVSPTTLVKTVRKAADYPARSPDSDLEAKIDRIDWEQDKIVTFVGNITRHKGVQDLVTAFPGIASRNGNARLLIAGRGPLREALEVLVHAFATGDRRLVRAVAELGAALEGEEPAPFTGMTAFLDRLDASGESDRYFRDAQQVMDPARILFTGYMEHELLSDLFPCCDVAVFPSVVKEAAPLVVPEAMASGCFPVGTDYAGMGAILDVAAQAVAPEDARWMRINPDPEQTVADLIEKVPKALEAAGHYRASLRELAVEQFDWKSVARKVAGHLATLAS
jgi:glycosyltransferase involved in cell wall biosynthesis